VLSVLLFGACVAPAQAEDGYDLWLRYRLLPNAEAVQELATQLVAPAGTPVQSAARSELVRGLSGLLGTPPALAKWVDRPGAIIVGTPTTLPQLAAFATDVADLAADGYLLRSVAIDDHQVIAVIGRNDIGALYGSFHLLRLLQTGQSLAALDLRESPAVQRRLLNHWDNLDRTVERGYAGASIWIS
jgi:alpha-glucuronidase